MTKPTPAMPRFQIFRTDPVYCPIRDGLIGSRTVALPMTYGSGRLAELLAAYRSHEEECTGGDASFHVAEAGSGGRPHYVSPERRAAWYGETLDALTEAF